MGHYRLRGVPDPIIELLRLAMTCHSRVPPTNRGIASFPAPEATLLGHRLNSLAFNVTAVDVTEMMGPLEIAPGTQWDDPSDLGTACSHPSHFSVVMRSESSGRCRRWGTSRHDQHLRSIGARRTAPTKRAQCWCSVWTRRILATPKDMICS